MIDRFAVYVATLSEPLGTGIRWTVSWRIDDMRQSNKTLKGNTLTQFFSTEALAETAGRRASMEQLDRLIDETVRTSRQTYIEPADGQD